MKTTSEPPSILSRPGSWFWSAIVIGAAIRFYLVVFTQGTYDVPIWERHARAVNERGLIGYYRADTTANHAPFISEVEALLVRAADATGIPFRIWLRAPFALLDAATAFLLLLLLRPSAWRFVLAAGYWLNPLALILSAYHGNTDCAVAFFLLLSVWLLSKEKTIPAAIAIGASLWIKLPGILAIPALVFFVQGWRRRLLFLAVAGIVALSTYLPALIQDAPTVYANVFGYRAQNLHTVAGESAWGPRVLLFSIIASPEKWPSASHQPILFYLEHGWKFSIALVVLLSWLRRGQRSVHSLCATIAMSYLAVYAFSDGWSFQYFAWSLPFWFFLPAWFFIPGILLAGGYFYSLYWYLCGNPWLRGWWDFANHLHWPPVVIWLRNLATAFFFLAACVLLASTMWQQRRMITIQVPASQVRR